MATLSELELLYQNLLVRRSELAAQYQAGDTTVLAEIESVNARIRTTLISIENLTAIASSPPQSAGGTVINAQIARDDGANTQLPEPPTVVLGPNGRIVTPVTASGSGVTESGTDDELRPIINTQAVPPPTASGALPSADAAAEIVPYGPNSNEMESMNDIFTAPNSRGVGAVNDDGVTPAGNGPGNPNNTTENNDGVPGGSNEVVTLVNKGDRQINPEPNILDRFASYTYSVSIYIMSPEDYSRLLTSKKKYIPGFQLLIQSAGAPLSSGVVPDSNASSDESGDNVLNNSVSLTSGRNDFFPLDYYIDDLKIESLIAGRGSGGAHNVNSMSFKITEPNGITLINNLYRAAQQYNKQGGGASRSVVNNNYAAQNYLMVIRFYGYDNLGNLVVAPSSSLNSSKSDSRAIVEKFIPFQFQNIRFRIANRLTEYECTAVCPQNAIGTSQPRAVIPYNIELTATTLQNLFNGNTTYTDSTTPGAQNNNAPDKANAAPNPTLTTGLVQALNKFQDELVKAGTFTKADRYKIVISHPEIANASVVPPGGTQRQATPMANATTAAQQKDGTKTSVNNNAITKSATAGMSIVQFIDLAVRNSDYIYKQQVKIIDKDGKEVPQGTAAQAFAWYHIGVQAKPLGPDQDPKRGDYAYEITYEIAPYLISDIKSDYFPKGKFRGVHKKYNYWFTGENASVINFEQEFNHLYYITVNTRQGRMVSSSGTSDYREIEKRIFSPNSPQSNQGIEGNVNEPAANAADYLYSPSDQGNAKLTIVGDPAWIRQGELWSGVRSTSSPGTVNTTNSDSYFAPFLPDGTINFDAREALFEIVFNKPVDYDLNTGVMKVTGSNTTSQNYIYRPRTVTSLFNKGKFLQELEGMLLIFPGSITATTQTETSRTTTSDPNETVRTNSGAQGGIEQSTNTDTSNSEVTVDNQQGGTQELPNGQSTTPAGESQPPTSSGQTVGENSSPGGINTPATTEDTTQLIKRDDDG